VAGLALLLVLLPARARADADLDEAMEKAIKEAVKKVAPSVVQIETTGGTEVISSGPRGSVVRKGIGPTTGVIVSPDGFIVSSAFNFANKPSSIIVAIPGQPERLVAKVVATDQTRMLTLLKVDAKDLPVPTPAPKNDVKIGHTAIAVGRTLPANIEQPPSISVGIISATGRIWGKALQTDAKISPTNYGGPLVDLEGRVQGVLVPASPRAEGETAGLEWYDSGIGFAIPLEDINRALPRLKEGKDLKHGVLGVTMKTQDEFADEPVIGAVAPGSAAEKAGIKPNDVIKEIDGKPVGNHAQVRHHIGAKYEGDSISIKLLRGKDEVITLEKVVLSGAVAAFGQPFLGILPMRDDPDPGVAVRYVYAKGPAETAGLKVGDRIMKIGRQRAPGQPVQMQPVQNRDQLAALLEQVAPGTEIQIEVTRKEGKKTETLKVKLGETPDAVPEKLPRESSAGKALGKPANPKEDKKDEKKDDKKAETGLLKKTTAAADHSYWVYVPTNYDPNVAHALVLWFHPAGKNKDKDVDDFTDAWQDYCEDNHVILLGPKSDNERGWNGGDADFVQEAVKAVMEGYTIDKRRVVAHGMGLGGEMSFYMGFHNRGLVRGVATTGAALTSNPKEKVANQPLSFFLVVGGKDPLKDSVAESKKKLAEFKYAVIYREIENMGHQYLDTRVALPTLDELARWVDSLDRL
jgi:S1-C subfamily serine protease/dienelactone hydrolase